jgi:hypothetical protein
LNFFVFTKVEIISFIGTEEDNFSFLKDDVWWLRVSFLSDFFDKLKEVNLSLQEAEENFITIRYKLKAFKEILILWNSKSTNQTLNEQTLFFRYKPQASMKPRLHRWFSEPKFFPNHCEAALLYEAAVCVE